MSSTSTASLSSPPSTSSSVPPYKLRVLSFNVWEDAKLGLSRVVEAVRKHMGSSITTLPSLPQSSSDSSSSSAAPKVPASSPLICHGADGWIISFQEISRGSLSSVCSAFGLSSDLHSHFSACRSDVRKEQWGLGVISSLPISSRVDPSTAGLLPLLPSPPSLSTIVSNLNDSKEGSEWLPRWINANSIEITLPSSHGGHVIRSVNSHLHYKPYGPYIVMDGIKEILGGKGDQSPPRIVSLDDERKIGADAVQQSDLTQGADVDAISYLLLNKPSPSSTSLPITMFMGDFNISSHMDWCGTPISSSPTSDQKVTSTAPTGGSSFDDISPAREYGLHVPVAWPVSTKLHAIGFEDAFRVAHPNPRGTPGYTWPALTEAEMGFPALDDRIDFIYIRPQFPSLSSLLSSSSTNSLDHTPIRVVNSRTIGREKNDWPDEKGWPSDHYAVSIELHINA